VTFWTEEKKSKLILSSKLKKSSPFKLNLKEWSRLQGETLSL
jgi:hypothetical protein